MPTGTVTVTQGGSTAAGSAAWLGVLTGQAASPIGVTQAATNTTPSLASGTGVAGGSLVYVSVLGLVGTYTANGATTSKVDHPGQGLEYLTARATAATTAGVSVTPGYTATVNGISICLLEILKGAGTLAEDASTPGAFSTSTLTCTSGSFTPPPSSLLILAVQLNGGAGAVTAAVADTLGGLTWTNRAIQNSAGNGLSGWWTAPVPAAAASSGMLLVGDI